MSILAFWREGLIGILLIACFALYGTIQSKEAALAKKDSDIVQWKSAYMTLSKGVQECTAATTKMVDDEKKRLQIAAEARKKAADRVLPIQKKRRDLMALDAPKDESDCKRADTLLTEALNGPESAD